MPHQRIYITKHAAERFVQRHADDVTFAEATDILIRESRLARRVRDRELEGGTWRYVSDALECEMLVKRNDEGCGCPLICVTVLPRKDSDEAAWRREMSLYLGSNHARWSYKARKKREHQAVVMREMGRVADE